MRRCSRTGTTCYANDVDVIVGGDDHVYERFAPQDPQGYYAPSRGIRQFTVGTGGGSLYTFAEPKANSEVRYRASYGILKLKAPRDLIRMGVPPDSRDLLGLRKRRLPLSRRRLMVGLAATLCVGGFVVIMWIVVDGGSPSLALLAPAAGSFTNDSTPPFTGRASDSTRSDVHLRVYRGVRAEGRPLRIEVGRVLSTGAFSIALRRPLTPGTYTAVVLQREGNGATRKSAPSTFVYWQVSTTKETTSSVVGLFRGDPGLGEQPAPGGHGAISFDGTDDELLVFDAPPLDATHGATVQVRLNPGRRRAPGRTW